MRITALLNWYGIEKRQRILQTVWNELSQKPVPNTVQNNGLYTFIDKFFQQRRPFLQKYVGTS